MNGVFELADNIEWIEKTALWAYDEWHKKNGFPYKLVKYDYSLRASSLIFPKCFVYVLNSVPVGMVSVKKRDLLTMKKIGPWLSALYVDKKNRCSGIGSVLIDYAVDYIQKKGFPDIFLFTEYDKKEFLTKYYTKRGWNFYCSTVDSFNREVNVLMMNLDKLYRRI